MKNTKMTDISLTGNRIIAIDFFRGLAILGVVLTHCLIYGVFYTIDNALSTVPPGLLAVFSPIVLISPMAGLFAFISVVANTFTALRRKDNGHSSASVIQPIVLTSLVLILLHFVFSTLFKCSSGSMFTPGVTINTIVPASIRQSQLILPQFENLLYMDALSMIGISGLTSAAVLAFLLKKPFSTHKLTALTAIGFIAALLSPFLWYLFWKPFRFFYFSAYPLRLLSIPLSFFAARMHCLPGILPFIIFGVWFGFFLHSRPTYREVKKKTFPIAVASTVLFCFFVGVKLFLILGNETHTVGFLSRIGLLSFLAENTPGILTGNIGNAFLDYKSLPVEFQFFGIALIFWGFPLLMKQFDYDGEDKREKRISRIRPVLRFGTLSLTICVFETPVHTVFAKGLHALSGIPVPDMNRIQPDFFMTHPLIWIAYAAFIILLWVGILKLWEKQNYKLSLEWLLVKATAPLRKIKSEKLSVR